MNLGKKGFISLYNKFTIQGSQGRTLEILTDAEIMEECCLLACSSWLAKPTFL